jgi:hypothetical protein
MKPLKEFAELNYDIKCQTYGDHLDRIYSLTYDDYKKDS